MGNKRGEEGRIREEKAPQVVVAEVFVDERRKGRRGISREEEGIPKKKKGE